MLHFFSFFRRALGAVAVLLALPAAAQTLDRTFQPVDTRIGPSNYPTDANCLKLDAQGRAVVGGTFDFVAGQPTGNIVRLLPDGTPDPTFNPGGTGANHSIRLLAALPGGKWLIAGYFTYYNGRPARRLARLFPDGALDTTFHVGAGPDNVVAFMSVDSQGRVVLGGYFRHYDGHPVPGLVRVLPTGAFDPSFQPPAGLARGDAPRGVAVDAADRVLVGCFDSAQVATLERLLPSGALDTTFRAGGGRLRGGWIQRLQVLTSGEIMLSFNGGTATFDGVDLPYVARLHPNGTPDRSFAPTIFGAVRAIQELPNGQLLLGGNDVELYNGTWPPVYKSLVRLRRDGTVDTTFHGPSLTNQYHVGGVAAIAVDAAGQVVIGGDFVQVWGRPQAGVARLRPDGATVDPTLATPALDHHAHLFGLAAQSGDRVLALGYFRSVNGQPAQSIVRFRADGTLDPTFQPDPALRTNALNRGQLLVDAADRILVINYAGGGGMMRFLPDGGQDMTYHVGAGPGGINSSANTHVIGYPDGRVLYGGSFATYDNVARPSLVRLLADGTVDTTFTPPAQLADQAVTSLALLPDGTVALTTITAPTGPFPPTGPEVQATYWLDSRGHPLASFHGGQPWTDSLRQVSILTALPDTTLLISRNVLDWYSTLTRPQTLKLTRTGAIDSSFVLHPSLVTFGLFVRPQPDGRLLVLGDFPNGQSERIQRLLPTGDLDPSFHAPEMLEITDMLIQPSGKLMVAGNFTTVDGEVRPNLARFNNLLTAAPAESGQAGSGALRLYPNPTHDHFTLRRLTAEGATATLLDVLGRPVRQWPLTAAETRLSVAGVPAGAYVVRVVGTSGVLTRRVVVE